MFKKWKGVIIGVLCALAGGLTVFAVVKAKPELISKAEPVITKTEPDTTSRAWEQRSFDDILRDQEKIFKNFDTLFDQDFFRHNDPFSDMKSMRERLDRQFDEWNKDLPGGILSSPFDSWYGGRFGGSLEDISQREDAENIYYDIRVEGLDESKVNTKVENGFVTITGEMKKSSPEKSDSKTKSFYQSSFRRVFPVPANVDADRMEMISESGKVVLKFPKRK